MTLPNDADIHDFLDSAHNDTAQPPAGEASRLTAHEIELIRACLDDGTYTAQERKDIGLLCDMALRADGGSTKNER